MAVIDLRARAWGRIERARNHPGHPDQKVHGRGSSTGDRVSREKYEQIYGGPDERESIGFASLADGAGEVRAFPGEGGAQIAFENDDRTTSIFRDLDASEATAVADRISWASELDTSADALGDRGPDPDNGLVAWKSHESTGLLVGVRPDGGVSLVSDDDSNLRIDLQPGKSASLENALYEAAEIASE